MGAMWGDKTFDWKGLSKAESKINYWGYKIGRINGQIKEKYGEIRWYAYLHNVEKISDLVFPGFIYYQWPADRTPIKHVFDLVSTVYMRLLKYPIYYYQRFFYGFAYRQAIKAAPLLYREILISCDHEKLLFKRERKLYKSLL